MSKIQPWHLFVAVTLLCTVMTIDAVIDKEYIIASFNFIAAIANGAVAYTHYTHYKLNDQKETKE